MSKYEEAMKRVTEIENGGGKIHFSLNHSNLNKEYYNDLKNNIPENEANNRHNERVGEAMLQALSVVEEYNQLSKEDKNYHSLETAYRYVKDAMKEALLDWNKEYTSEELRKKLSRIWCDMDFASIHISQAVPKHVREKMDKIRKEFNVAIHQ